MVWHLLELSRGIPLDHGQVVSRSDGSQGRVGVCRGAVLRAVASGGSLELEQRTASFSE